MSATKRALRDADITTISWLSTPSLHPERRTAAVVETRVSDATGLVESQLLFVDLDETGTAGPPVSRVVTWPARWDRSGCQVAVARDIDGLVGPWLVEPGSGGASTAMRRLTSSVQTGPASWSADSEWLAFPARAAGSSLDVMQLVHVASGRTVDHADRTGSVRTCVWSPIGKQIATVVDKGGAQGASLWICDIDNGTRWCVASALGAITSPTWSPDGTRLAFIAIESLADQAANHTLEVVPAAGGVRTRLGGELDVSFGQRAQSDDPRGYDEPTLRWPLGERGVLTTYSFGGRTRLAWVTENGVDDIVDSDQVVLDFDCADDGETIAYISSDPHSPGELHVAVAGHHRQVTDRNADWRSCVQLAEVSRQLIPSQGGDIEAWVVHPLHTIDRTEAAPVIVAIHGGPHWPTGWRFSFEFQRHAALGRTVVVANPRGSQGYGAAFSRANQGDWGGCDADDIRALMELVELPETADRERIALTGVSYGGYLACLVASRCDQVKAVIGENLVSDLARYVESSGDLAFAVVEFGGLPADRPAFYADRSPVTHAATLTAPVLLIHGELDDNCPIEQSELLVASLRSHGRIASMLRIPDEGHAMVIEGSLSHRLLRWSEIDRFLDQHLSTIRAEPGDQPWQEPR